MHFQQISGSVGLGELIDEPDERRPKGALILACLAVSFRQAHSLLLLTGILVAFPPSTKVLRALKSMRTGDLKSNYGDFSSDTFSSERVELAQFIDMTPSTWIKIIEASKAFAPKGVRRSTTRKVVAAPAAKRAVMRPDLDDEGA